jgi:SET domain-containing protein 6
VLFRIPRNIVLSVQNSSFSQTHKNLLDQLESDPWLQLILVMMFEYGRGSESPWKPYFDVLPEEFDTLMYWSDEELAELEQSAVVGKIGKAGANSNFKQRIVPVVRNEPALFGFNASVSEDDVLQRAHRMASTIMAYGFDIEPEVKETDDDGYATEEEADDWPKGMVPLADMLNAEGESKNNVSQRSERPS